VIYNLAYHRDLQGLIYRFLRDSEFKMLHDKKGCKYFSFSNLIPPTRMIDEGSSKSLIVASPDRVFIETLLHGMDEIVSREVKVGEMAFRVEATEVFSQDLPRDALGEFTLTSGTPIVVRIPQTRLSEYGITPRQPYKYVYWRKEHAPTAFMKQLEENLVKKYNKYYDSELEPTQIFEQLQFKKQVAVPLRMKGEESIIIGTLWDFHFAPLDDLRRNLLQFGLDAGFGEMNSLGFGFINMDVIDCAK